LHNGCTYATRLQAEFEQHAGQYLVYKNLLREFAFNLIAEKGKFVAYKNKYWLDLIVQVNSI